jgi:hypothetical protein
VQRLSKDPRCVAVGRRCRSSIGQAPWCIRRRMSQAYKTARGELSPESLRLLCSMLLSLYLSTPTMGIYTCIVNRRSHVFGPHPANKRNTSWQCIMVEGYRHSSLPWAPQTLCGVLQRLPLRHGSPIDVVVIRFTSTPNSSIFTHVCYRVLTHESVK